MWGAGYRVRGLRCGGYGLGFGVQVVGGGGWDVGFGDKCKGFRVQGPEFRVKGVGLRCGRDPAVRPATGGVEDVGVKSPVLQCRIHISEIKEKDSKFRE